VLLLQYCKYYKIAIFEGRQIIIDDHDYELLAQNLSTFRRTMWKEAMLSTIASSSDFDISAIQFATLFLLAGEGELTIKRVAELLGRSVSATSRMLDQLVIRGLVSRNEDTRDRRTKRVSLSENGQAFVQALEQKRAEAQIAVMAFLSPEECAVVERAMQLLALAARRHADEHARSKISPTKNAEER
jgi:DNA-binding MarR family transcriptional regulator